MRARIILNVSNVEAGAEPSTSVSGKSGFGFVAHGTFSGWYIAKDTRTEITQQTHVFLPRFLLLLLSFQKPLFSASSSFLCTQGRIKLFGAPRQ